VLLDAPLADTLDRHPVAVDQVGQDLHRVPFDHIDGQFDAAALEVAIDGAKLLVAELLQGDDGLVYVLEPPGLDLLLCPGEDLAGPLALDLGFFEEGCAFGVGDLGKRLAGAADGDALAANLPRHAQGVRLIHGPVQDLAHPVGEVHDLLGLALGVQPLVDDHCRPAKVLAGNTVEELSQVCLVVVRLLGDGVGDDVEVVGDQAPGPAERAEVGVDADDVAAEHPHGAAHERGGPARQTAGDGGQFGGGVGNEGRAPGLAAVAIRLALDELPDDVLGARLGVGQDDLGDFLEALAVGVLSGSEHPLECVEVALRNRGLQWSCFFCGLGGRLGLRLELGPFDHRHPQVVCDQCPDVCGLRE